MEHSSPTPRGPGRRLQVAVLTPEGSVFDGPAEHVVVPGHDGEVAFFVGHAPFVGQLGCGELRITAAPGAPERFYVEGGVATVAEDLVTVLADRALEATEVDRTKAEGDLEAALALLPNTDEAFADRDRRVESARARLAVTERQREARS